MACALPESPTSVLRVELTCPVCLELYLEPHQLPCGHNFCLHCLQRLIRPQRALFRCPECRVTCLSTDQLQKNFKLANIADHYRNRRQGQGATSTHRGPSSRLVPLPAKTQVMVLCDYCAPAAAWSPRPFPAWPVPGTSASWDGNPRSSGTGAVATKMCLKCEVMMCQEHLRPHLELPAFHGHPLTDPTEFIDFRKWKCQDHDEIYSYYCMDEKTFVCSACIVEGGHKDHTIKTLRNATKDLKGALEHQLNTAEKKSTITELKLQVENEKERHNNNFAIVTENYMRRLRAEMHVKMDGFVDRLLDLAHNHCILNALDIHKNIKKIKEDKVRLQEVCSDIQGLMSQNPFHFIEAYKKREEQLQKKLQQRLFKPEYVECKKTHLGVQMEREMKAYLNMEHQALNTMDDILTLCNFTEEEEEEEIGVETLEVIREEDEEEEEEDEGEEEEDEGTSSEEDEVGEEEVEDEGTISQEDEQVGEEEDEGTTSEEDEMGEEEEDEGTIGEEDEQVGEEDEEEDESTSSEEEAVREDVVVMEDEEEEGTSSEEDEVGEEEGDDQVYNPEDDDDEEEDGEEEEEEDGEEEELTTDSEQDSDINQ